MHLAVLKHRWPGYAAIAGGQHLPQDKLVNCPFGRGLGVALLCELFHETAVSDDTLPLAGVDRTVVRDVFHVREHVREFRLGGFDFSGGRGRVGSVLTVEGWA